MAHREDIVPVPIVGDRIAEFRRRRGLTQEALASRLTDLGWENASKFTVTKAENDARQLDAHELAMLARALDCRVSDLFGETAPSF